MESVDRMQKKTDNYKRKITVVALNTIEEDHQEFLLESKTTKAFAISIPQTYEESLKICHNMRAFHPLLLHELIFNFDNWPEEAD